MKIIYSLIPDNKRKDTQSIVVEGSPKAHNYVLPLLEGYYRNVGEIVVEDSAQAIPEDAEIMKGWDLFASLANKNMPKPFDIKED